MLVGVRAHGAVHGERYRFVAHHDDGRLELRREREGAAALWDLHEHRAVEHGYATTVSLAGRTVDAVSRCSRPPMRRGLYVEVTRAREEVIIADGTDEVRDFGHLLVRAQRDDGKMLVRDVIDEQERALAREQTRPTYEVDTLVHSQFSGYGHVKREDGDWRLYDGELHANQATAGGSTSATTPTQDSASSGADASTNTSDGRFSLMSCGAVSDSKTGLVWLLGPDENMAWDATVAWAESDDACGRKWRLPTIHELATLYDPQLSAGTGYYAQGTHCPAHISSLFSAIGGGSWGWSSEVVDDDTARAYNFNQGVATQYAKNNVTYSTRAFAVAASP